MSYNISAKPKMKCPICSLGTQHDLIEQPSPYGHGYYTVDGEDNDTIDEVELFMCGRGHRIYIK